MNYDVLRTLTDDQIQAMIASLKSGMLSIGVTQATLNELAGTSAKSIQRLLDQLMATGMSARQCATVLDAVYQTRISMIRESPDPDLIISGPEVSNVLPKSTEALMQTLFPEAKREILIVTYAIHNGNEVFKPLVACMERSPGLKVRLCVNIPACKEGMRSEEQVVQRYMRNFRQKHWPGDVLPLMYYYPRAFVTDQGVVSSLHTKCVVIDRSAAFVTSANFTKAAKKHNIETGVLLRRAAIAEKLATYFDRLIECGELRRCE